MVGVAEKNSLSCIAYMRAWALELKGLSGARDNQPINGAKLKREK
jgi:hypothetical protein